jgi:hypothetical protein
MGVESRSGAVSDGDVKDGEVTEGNIVEGDVSYGEIAKGDATANGPAEVFVNGKALPNTPTV